MVPPYLPLNRRQLPASLLGVFFSRVVTVDTALVNPLSSLLKRGWGGENDGSWGLQWVVWYHEGSGGRTRTKFRSWVSSLAWRPSQKFDWKVWFGVWLFAACYISANLVRTSPQTSLGSLPHSTATSSWFQASGLGTAKTGSEEERGREGGKQRKEQLEGLDPHNILEQNDTIGGFFPEDEQIFCMTGPQTKSGRGWPHGQPPPHPLNSPPRRDCVTPFT